MVNVRRMDIYSYPLYHKIAYSWNVPGEVDFLEKCFRRFSSVGANGRSPLHLPVRSIIDVGCGSGRHTFELARRQARRGYEIFSFDKNPQMIDYVRENSPPSSRIEAAVMPMQKFETPRRSRGEPVPFGQKVSPLRGDVPTELFDAAICMMDTFRFLLSDDDIKEHFDSLWRSLNPGGLYITDFWVPTDREKPVGFSDEWFREDGGIKVKTVYRQYAETLNRTDSTFEDELSYEVDDNGVKKNICERARTRLLFPEDFDALAREGGFEILAQFSDFDANARWKFGDWRLISVLKRAADTRG